MADPREPRLRQRRHVVCELDLGDQRGRPAERPLHDLDAGILLRHLGAHLVEVGLGATGQGKLVVLHTVILHRRQHDPATKDYIARRVAEGKSTRDATRILKRYLARHLYRVLDNQVSLMT